MGNLLYEGNYHDVILYLQAQRNNEKGAQQKNDKNRAYEHMSGFFFESVLKIVYETSIFVYIRKYKLCFGK